MIFLSGLDGVVGVDITSPPRLKIDPPTNPTIGQPPSNAIPRVPPMRIPGGPSGRIVRGPGVAFATRGGLPFTRTMRPRNITFATATLPAFRVPGAGEEATSLGPQSIQRGSSGAIQSIFQSVVQNPQVHLLDAVRINVQPLLRTLAALPSDKRARALREAFKALNNPYAASAVERLSMKFVARGAQSYVALREALSRVLATNIVMATRQRGVPAQRFVSTGTLSTEAATLVVQITELTRKLGRSSFDKAAASSFRPGPASTALDGCDCNGVVSGVGGDATPSVSDAKATLLRLIRDSIQPLVATIGEIPRSERADAVSGTFELLGLPDAAAAVKRQADRLVDSGVPADAAFREALTRVLATSIAIVMPTQYEAARQRAIARGVDPAALSGALDSAWKAVKKVGKAVVKVHVLVAKKVSQVVSAVACSSIGKAAVATVGGAVAAAATGGPGALAGPVIAKGACAAATLQTDMLKKADKLVNGKKAKRKSGAAAPAPQASAPVASNKGRAVASTAPVSPSRRDGGRAAREASAPARAARAAIAAKVPASASSAVRAGLAAKAAKTTKRNILIAAGVLAAGGLVYVMMNRRKKSAGVVTTAPTASAPSLQG